MSLGSDEAEDPHDGATYTPKGVDDHAIRFNLVRNDEDDIELDIGKKVSLTASFCSL